MNDEKIELPNFLLAELYKSTLVELDIETSAAPENTRVLNIGNKELPAPEKEVLTTGIRYLGENGKGVIIIVNEPKAVFLPDDDITFLTNILKACNLHLGDIAIINTAKQDLAFEKMKEQCKAQTILLFDVEPSAIHLPFMIPVFQIQKYSGCTIMVAPPFALLNKPDNQGKLLKTKLWLSLKSIFNIP